MSAKEIVVQHLRAVEAGEWDKALALIAPDYQLQGVIPFPISLFIRIGKAQSLDMHKARKRALPDFQFNEQYLEETPQHVKFQVNLTGTQTGVIDYRGLVRGIPVIQPTGKAVKLDPEWFTYYVRDGLIHKTVGNIPKDAGVPGLVRAVTGE
ncbi:MAG: nuclear transport factor 2 family protein [Chloroflexota bacterium]|nr:nuclear transport factor 2 family protein [Chloroflexota bacterium]